MNRLSKKFIISIVCILTLSSLFSIVFNTQFLERFYLYQKKMSISKICDEFTDLLQQNISPQNAVKQTEAAYKVIIAEIEDMPSSGNNEVNEKIQAAFQNKGIGFQKYWFWEEDYKKVLEGERRIKLYRQEKLNYSLLIEYLKHDSGIYAITMIVPDVSDSFQIANTFLIVVDIFTIVTAIIFIIFLINKITKPLLLFGQFAEHMRKNQFIPVSVSTNDELEEVADSLNLMGSQISMYQQSLQEKNLQMKQLLENVAHDLKTPVSLIQLYANGMKDGIDDGTFLNTILEENEQMSAMINRLLYLSGIEKNQSKLNKVDLSELLSGLISKYTILAEERQTEIHSKVEDNVIISGNEELLQSLFLNLITNAIKYSAGKEIVLNLFKQDDKAVFSISNDTDNATLDIEKIWTPYYVGERSRNKKLSGTGLGLSIVKKICETQGYDIDCRAEGNKIRFTVTIPV